MKINDNGIIRKMTPEEIAEHERTISEAPPVLKPDLIEEWKLQIESALIELASIVGGT